MSTVMSWAYKPWERLWDGDQRNMMAGSVIQHCSLQGTCSKVSFWVPKVRDGESYDRGLVRVSVARGAWLPRPNYTYASCVKKMQGRSQSIRGPRPILPAEVHAFECMTLGWIRLCKFHLCAMRYHNVGKSRPSFAPTTPIRIARGREAHSFHVRSGPSGPAQEPERPGLVHEQSDN